MTIKIVTDSACDVPSALAAELGITVVPVYINVGEQSYLEGVEITRAEFYRNLPTYDPYPTTAAPATGTFAEVYERLTAEGATSILSMHLASSLSATYNAARLGAEAAESAPVTLFDTEQITAGAGLLVLCAAEAVLSGRSLNEILAVLEERVARTRVFGVLDTLDSLRRSGRVSWTQFNLGTLLQIKPVMMIWKGQVEVVAKVRTSKRSVQHLLQMLETYSPLERLAVIHVNAAEAAAQLRRQAEHLFPAGHKSLTVEITPAIGTHLGLGAVGFACISAGE